MITHIHIENYKSVLGLDMGLGRINVLIGENGCGKSNILEAIALASATAHEKLDNEFLASRGIRVTEPRFMRAAFSEAPSEQQEIKVDLKGDTEGTYHCRLDVVEGVTYPKWINKNPLGFSMDELQSLLSTTKIKLKFVPITESPVEQRAEQPKANAIEVAITTTDQMASVLGLAAKQEESALPQTVQQAIARRKLIPDFLIYSPENTSLRTFQREGQILPLGIKAEGLFAHLKALASVPNSPTLAELIEKLSLIDWFESLEIPHDLSPDERTLRIRDRYLTEGALFDQRSANEGFLFLLFYFTLFASPETPAFLAIDNIDASLNPKLCSALTTELVALAKRHDKQAILTTHNPAVLDGLDLKDDEQRLFVVYRDRRGATKVRRVEPPKPLEGAPPIKLSEAFMRGYIGGLPKNF